MKRLILALTAVAMIGCGSEEDEEQYTVSTVEPTSQTQTTTTDPLIGSWFIEDGPYCAMGFNVEVDAYVMIYLCMINDNTAEMSYKIIERQGNLKGVVRESTCPDVGITVGYNGTIYNGKLDVDTGGALITGFEKTPASESSGGIAHIYGCYGNDGIFEQTQVYK